MKKIIKSLFCFLLVFTLVLPLGTVFKASAASVSISVKKKTLYVGQTFQLKLKNASGSVNWGTSKQKVATVSSNGLVKAVKKGTATITATYNKKTYSCKVTVKNPYLNKKNAKLALGETFTLKVTGTTAKSFSSSNSSVASVDSKGTVSAKQPGKATISVKCDNGKTYKCKVSVAADNKLSGTIKLELSNGTVKKGTTYDSKIDTNGKDIKYVYFGSYPTEEVTGLALTNTIKNLNYNAQGFASLDGTMYRRVSASDPVYNYYAAGGKDISANFFDWSEKDYAYFKFDYIKWTVLENDNGILTLVATDAIDCKRFNESAKTVGWDKSTIRSWLNGYDSSKNSDKIDYIDDGESFLTIAFNTDERKLLLNTELKDSVENPFGKTGVDTKDKVFLLSVNEALNTDYGFSSDGFESDNAKRASLTDYAYAMGVEKNFSITTANGDPTCIHWLRSQGDIATRASVLYEYGYIVLRNAPKGTRGEAVENFHGVCPMIRVDLSKIIK